MHIEVTSQLVTEKLSRNLRRNCLKPFVGVTWRFQIKFPFALKKLHEAKTP